MIVTNLESSVCEHNVMVTKIITQCEYILQNSRYLDDYAKDRKIWEIIEMAKYYTQDLR